MTDQLVLRMREEIEEFSRQLNKAATDRGLCDEYDQKISQILEDLPLIHDLWVPRFTEVHLDSVTIVVDGSPFTNLRIEGDADSAGFMDRLAEKVMQRFEYASYSSMSLVSARESETGNDFTW